MPQEAYAGYSYSQLANMINGKSGEILGRSMISPLLDPKQTLLFFFFFSISESFFKKGTNLNVLEAARAKRHSRLAVCICRDAAVRHSHLVPVSRPLLSPKGPLLRTWSEPRDEHPHAAVFMLFYKITSFKYILEMEM